MSQHVASAKPMLTHAGIDYKTSTTVKSVDLKSKSLQTESGDSIKYEKLIVATGSTVRGSWGTQLSSLQHRREKPLCRLLVPARPQSRQHWCSLGLGLSTVDLAALLPTTCLVCTSIHHSPSMQPCWAAVCCHLLPGCIVYAVLLKLAQWLPAPCRPELLPL